MQKVKMGNLKLVAGVLGGLMVAGAAGKAHGALVLTLSEPGFTSMSGTVSGNTDSFIGTFGDFSTNIVIGSTNSTGPSTGLGSLQIQDLQVVSTAPMTAGTKTLTISLTDNGFTFPGMPGQKVYLDSSLGGTLTQPVAGDKVQFQATATPSTGAAATTGIQTYTATSLPNGNLSFNLPGTTSSFTQTGSYSLNETLTLSLSSPNEQANVGGSATVSTVAVPEPVSGSIAAFAGLALLGRRKRN